MKILIIILIIIKIIMIIIIIVKIIIIIIVMIIIIIIVMILIIFTVGQIWNLKIISYKMRDIISRKNILFLVRIFLRIF